VNLPDHEWWVGLGAKAAGRAHEPRRVARRRDDRWLLDRHGDEPIAEVHPKVESHAVRQPEDADGVLDHVVGRLEREGVDRQGLLHFGSSEPATLRQPRQALALTEAAEPGDP
jgi:hypothetical protein